jgi:hypothetical protein
VAPATRITENRLISQKEKSMGVDYMNGWDAMVVSSQANVNQAMVLAYNAGLLPKDVDVDFSFEVFGIPVNAHVKGQLGAWTFAGGSGKNVIVSIPFLSGTLTIGTQNYPLRGVVLRVTSLLSYIKSPIQPVGGTSYTIQVNFAAKEAIVAVTVLNPPPGVDVTNLEIVLMNFLKKALTGHTYDLATVDLGSIQKDYPYLVPTLFEYAVDTNSQDPNSSIFGVQMLTVNTTPGNQALVPGTVPTGAPACDSAALVSNQILVQQLLLPGVATAIGVDAKNLTSRLVGGSWSIINKGDITLSSEKNPVLSSLNAWVDNDLVKIDLVGSVEASAGITVSFTVNASYKMKLTTSDKGVQKLDLVQVSSTNNHTVHVATWVIITASVLAALVMMVLGPVIALLVAGIEALIIYLIANIANNKVGELLSTSLPATVASKVSWSSLNLFTIKQALLPTPLQLGGIMPVLKP